MNISSTCDPALRQHADPGPNPRGPTDSTGETAHVTPELVQATRDEVRQITHEIAELSRQDLSNDSYFAQFLQHVTTALASVAGAVWSVDSQGSLRVMARVNDQSLGLRDDQHQRVLGQAVATGRPIVLGPRSNCVELGATNPSDQLLLLVPLQLEGRVTAVVEVFQRPHRGPATERGYLAYLVEMSELAERFLKSQRLRDLRAHHDWSQQLEQFLSEIHSRLGVDETAYCVVNEARRLAGVDRVSLALGSGRQCPLKVVSGLDSVDRRAEQVRQLGRLAARVIKGREPTWLDTHNGDLPPQIEKDWNRYVDISHVRRCGVFPLFPPGSSDQSTDQGEPFGALIFEQLSEATGERRTMQHVEQICRHSTSALHNALQHESIFLLPLWRALGGICESLGGRHFSKTLSVIIVCMAAAVALITTKANFTVPVRGKMQPQVRRTVFAQEDGVITRVAVEHGQEVQAGQVLAELRNTDLDVEITSLVGKQTTTRQQIFSLQRALLDDPRLDTAQQNRLNGELLQLQQLARSVERQLQLVRQKEQQLIVRADGAGQVVTWHVQDKLLHRPVQKGQALIAIVDPSAPWELELYVPARHSGHVLDAAARSAEPLPVTFVLSSHPGQQFQGTLLEVDEMAVERQDLGSAVRVRVAIDAQQLPELKTDATVVAKIHCGQRSLGYTWFHDLIDTVRSRVMFWL